MQRRTELLLGSDGMKRIEAARVMVFGIGGVGSWCAECLVRSGIRHITIVDADCVSATNCNRQLVATSRTIGRAKVDVMKERLLELNPDAEVVAVKGLYTAESAATFRLEEYDYVIDAIDSLKDKADLILRVTALPERTTLFSSMGAALRCDPLMVRRCEFYKVSGDPLARALRKRFKHMGVTPSRKFTCVCSEEKPMENQQVAQEEQQNGVIVKAQVNGSLCQVTATFGMALASLVINDIIHVSQVSNFFAELRRKRSSQF